MSPMLIYAILLAITIFINVFIMFNFCERMYQKVYQNPLIYIGLFLLSYLAILLINFMGLYELNLPAFTLLLLGIGIKLYGASKGSDILSMFLFILFISSIEIIGQMIISLIYATPFNLPAGSLAQSTIVFFSYQTLMFVIERKKLTFRVTNHWLTLVIIPMISLYLIFVIINLMAGHSSYKYVLLGASACILVFVSNIVVYFLFSRIALLHAQKEQYQMMEQQKQLQYRFFNELEQKNENARKLFHDIKNHLNTLEYLYEGDAPTASEYTHTLRKRMDDLTAPLAGNRVLNILLNDRKALAASQNIEWIVNCEDIDLTFISDFDLTTIMSNLLDNAFDECINNNLEKNTIEISICQINYFIVFLVANSCMTEPKRRGSRYLSQKENHMGLGILNVQDVVDQYGGSMNITYKDNFFTVQITFSGQNNGE